MSRKGRRGSPYWAVMAAQSQIVNEQLEAAGMSWPIRERGESIAEGTPPVIDWTLWRKCPACRARTGHPCWCRTGGGEHGTEPLPLDRPHTLRRRRTGR